MMLTESVGVDLKVMFWMGWMWLRHMAGRKDVQIRFVPVAVSKTLPVILDRFDVIARLMSTL